MDANTGKTIWTFDYATSYRDDFGFDEGPRAVPVIAGGRVFTHGADGMLHGIDFASGKMLWSVDTRKVFEAPKGYFGVASSPVVDGARVLVNVGGTKGLGSPKPGEGGGIVAFDAASGKTLWTATSDEPSYSAPIIADIADNTSGVFFTAPDCRRRSRDWKGVVSIPVARAAGGFGECGNADRGRRSNFFVGELWYGRGAAASRQQRGEADLVRRRVDVESLFDERAEGRLSVRLRRTAGIRSNAALHRAGDGQGDVERGRLRRRPLLIAGDTLVIMRESGGSRSRHVAEGFPSTPAHPQGRGARLRRSPMATTMSVTNIN